MQSCFKNKRGFTLIELLVVISIIGLLSSVIFTTVNGAKTKARDAAVRQGVIEFTKLFQLEYSDTGSYANLQSCQWVPADVPNCDSMFSGNYAVQARNVCNNIVSNAPLIWGTPGYKLLICNPDPSQKYSIMVTINNDLGEFFCAGSGGVTNKAQYWMSKDGSIRIDSDPLLYNLSPNGCYYNP